MILEVMDVLLRFNQKVIILMDAKSIIEYLVFISMKNVENQINGYLFFFCNISNVIVLMVFLQTKWNCDF